MTSLKPKLSGDLPGCQAGAGFLRILLRQKEIGVALIDSRSGRFLEVNSRYAEIVGLSPAQMLATDFMTITYGEDLAQDLAEMKRMREGKSPGFSMEKRYRRPDGSLVWVKLRVLPTWEAGAEPSTHIALVEDISGSKKAARMLEALELLAPVFLDHRVEWDQAMADGLRWLGEAAEASRAYVFRLHADAEGTLVASQDYEWTAAGVSPQIENPGLQDVPVIEAGFGRWLEVLPAGGVISGQVANFSEAERQLLDPQGVVSLMVVAIFVHEEPWGFLGFDACEPGSSFSEHEVGILRSAASILGAAMEQRHAEAELEARDLELYEAQKMKAVGQLAGGIAHDFNNSLTVILGNLGLAMDQLEADHPARTYLAELDKAAERSSRVARQLLQVSRRQSVDGCDFQLHEELDEVVRLLRPLLGSSIRLHTQSEGRLPSLHGDPGQIGQVILNLCLNAREAMPEGGEIELATRLVEEASEVARFHERALLYAGPAAGAGGGGEAPQPLPQAWVELSVRDTGSGMSPAVLREAFQPFFSTKGPKRGAGLGLAVVHGIVVKHGGLIEAESEPGAGTVFRVYLPVRGTTQPPPR